MGNPIIDIHFMAIDGIEWDINVESILATNLIWPCNGGVVSSLGVNHIAGQGKLNMFLESSVWENDIRYFTGNFSDAAFSVPSMPHVLLLFFLGGLTSYFFRGGQTRKSDV